MAQLVKNSPAVRETWVWPLGWEDPLEKGKAAHSSIPAWRIPWTVWSIGSQSWTWLNNFHFQTQNHFQIPTVFLGFRALSQTGDSQWFQVLRKDGSEDAWDRVWQWEGVWGGSWDVVPINRSHGIPTAIGINDWPSRTNSWVCSGTGRSQKPWLKWDVRKWTCLGSRLQKLKATGNLEQLFCQEQVRVSGLLPGKHQLKARSLFND